MMPEIWAAPPMPPAGWPPCEWCGRKLDNPQFFLVRADGHWFALCLTCITAGDNSAGAVICRNCGRALWRREDARMVTVKRLFRKAGGRRYQYQCLDGCLPGSPQG